LFHAKEVHGYRLVPGRGVAKIFDIKGLGAVLTARYFVLDGAFLNGSRVSHGLSFAVANPAVIQKIKAVINASCFILSS
jgi:hypothetical protein